MDVSSEAIHSLLPVFMATVLGASMLTIGLLEGAAEATALIIKVFSGALSDWWGRRKPLAIMGYGLGALSKPLFALAGGMGLIVTARLLDRVGKGIRGAPRDALVADIAPPEMRGAAFGLRQSLDTAGAFLGPLLAMGLMLLWANDFRAVFWAATVPALLCVALLVWGVQEPERAARRRPNQPHQPRQPETPEHRLLGRGGHRRGVHTGPFSEAFLVLRAQQGGLPLAAIPLVLIVLNVVFSAGRLPAGQAVRLGQPHAPAHGRHGGADRRRRAAGLAQQRLVFWLGVGLWGLHMALTQGLLATMIANAAPPDLRGTAFGMFNLVCGVAMLLASGLAGWLWDRFGAPTTFAAGMAFSALALAGLIARNHLTRGKR